MIPIFGIIFLFMIVYDYLYFHLFELVSKIRKLNARESTLLYLSAILFFITSPFVFAVLSLVLKYVNAELLYMVLSLGYGILIYFINKKYFERTNKLKDIKQKSEKEGIVQKRIGYCVVVLLFLSSFPLFLFLLSLT